MPKNNYNDDAKTARELIEEFGTDCSIIRNEGVLIDDTKPWYGEEDLPVSYPCQGVLLSVSDRDYKLYPNLTTVSADKKILVDPISLSINPMVGYKINHDGIDWAIVAVKDLKPANVNVLWTLFVRT